MKKLHYWDASVFDSSSFRIFFSNAQVGMALPISLPEMDTGNATNLEGTK